ncbi:MAG: PhnD/SsuA/transferrin family substrate-binding protein [Pseudomonadota bacterium]
MFASLPMYHRAETSAALDDIWAALRDAIKDAGLKAPDTLDQDQIGIEAWLRPDMVLSQTCGMPFRKHLHPHVTLVGTLDHGVESCPAGYYNSAIITRVGALPANPKPSINDMLSQSGYAALLEVLPEPHDPILSGGHLNSAQLVAEGKADIAAIDAVTWRMIEAYDPFSDQLQVIQHTKPRPGLPLITALPKEQAAQLRTALDIGLKNADAAAKELLGIKGLVHIPASAYLKVKP